MFRKKGRGFTYRSQGIEDPLGAKANVTGKLICEGENSRGLPTHHFSIAFASGHLVQRDLHHLIPVSFVNGKLTTIYVAVHCPVIGDLRIFQCPIAVTWFAYLLTEKTDCVPHDRLAGLTCDLVSI